MPSRQSTKDAASCQLSSDTLDGDMEEIMRKSFVLMTALAAFCAAPAALAADSACKLTGGWLGYLYGYASWVAVADAVSNSSGTITIDYPALDLALFGARPAGVRVGIARGVWERTGGGSFAYTTLAVAVDAAGIPVWLGKLVGTETLGPDCNVEKVTATFYAYEPWQNPYTDVPFLTVEQPDHYGYLMKAERPAK